jgi:hypothetical protein
LGTRNQNPVSEGSSRPCPVVISGLLIYCNPIRIGNLAYGRIARDSAPSAHDISVHSDLAHPVPAQGFDGVILRMFESIIKDSPLPDDTNCADWIRSSFTVSIDSLQVQGHGLSIIFS